MLQPGVGGVVEALVAKAPDVEYQRGRTRSCRRPRLRRLSLSAAAGAAGLTAGATDRQQRQSQHRRDKQGRCSH